MAVVSSCREMLLSPVTSATLVLSYQHLGWALYETAGDKPEEGGMTSSHHGPYGQGTHVLQWSVQRVAKPRGGANP